MQVNFGVELFLQRFLSLGQGPAARKLGGTAGGDAVMAPEHPEFSGFCFKLQVREERLFCIDTCQ